MTTRTRIAPKTEQFTINLTADQGRRLRFAAQEHGMTPSAFIAESAVASIASSLETLDVRSDEMEQTEIARKLNC